MTTPTYTDILAVQREQLDDKITELRFIADNLPLILRELNQRVIVENSKIDFHRTALSQVFRGQDLNNAVNKIVSAGLHDDARGGHEHVPATDLPGVQH
mgnify:FL=1